MNNLIEKIWQGNYNPAEKHIVCVEELKTVNSELNELEKQLLPKLDKESKGIYNKIMSKYCDLLDYLMLDGYTKGAKFMGNLFFEIMKDN